MKNRFIYILISIFSLMLFSCKSGGVDPEETFIVVGLSLNKIPYKFSKHFYEIRAQHKNGSLTFVDKNNEVRKGVTAVEYVQNQYPDMLKKEIESIKNLHVNEETKPMQESALDLFYYTQEVYRTDMLHIAKMIDEGRSETEIDAAIEELQNTKGKIIDQKFNKTHDMIFPYADKNGIKYKTLDYIP